MANIGFIGLGIMGAPMAGHLQNGGHQLYLYARKGPPATLVEAGAVACASAAEVARRADIVILMVPDTPDGFASSRTLEVHDERMVTRTFNPGFRIELHQKDLNLALHGARALGVSLPNTSTVQELMNACVANGMGGLDHSALCRVVELLSNHEIGGPEAA